TENHVIECLVGVIGQPFVDVALEDRDAACDGFLYLGAGDFHAARIHALGGGQPLQQFAFAAAQVEHLGPRLDNFADDGIIAAAQELADEAGLHCTFSNVLARNPRTRSVCSTTSTRKESCP